MFLISSMAVLAWLTTVSLSSKPEGVLAPLQGMDVPTKWPDEYLVYFNSDHTLEQHFDFIGQNLTSSPHFLRYPFGYQATMDSKTRDELVRRDPGVDLLETNRPIYAIEPLDVELLDESPEPQQNGTALVTKRNYETSVELEAPYGLQMLTTPSEKLDVPIQDEGRYEYVFNAGLGVQVYVMDTGIRTTHELFEGRARNFGNLGPNDKSPYIDAKMADVRGHGTQWACLA